MTSRLAAAFRASRRFGRLAIGVALLFFPLVAMHGQCAPAVLDPDAPPPRPSATAAAGEDLLPESGHLSNHTYTSDFFGFSFDLPIAAQGHLIMLPLMPERQHALLALAYEDQNHSSSLTVAAIDPHNGLEDLTPEEKRQQFKNWSTGSTQIARPVRPTLPDYMLPKRRFDSTVHHKGENYTAVFWTRARNYNIKVLVASNDKDFLRKSKQAMSEAQFYCTQDDGSLTTPQGKPVKPEGEPYEGPTVPTARVNAALKDRPALHDIPLGGVSGGVYRNPALGVQYELPKDWEVLPAETDTTLPREATALREHEFLHACSQTLLRIAQPTAGDAAHGSRSMIVFRALDPTCLSMRTPASATDKKTADEVAASLEVLSEFGEIASDELVSIADQLFMLFRGTIASPVANDELAQRMSQLIFVTRHNKMLLVWSLIAPNSAKLNAIPSPRVALDGAQYFELQPPFNAKKQ